MKKITLFLLMALGCLSAAYAGLSTGLPGAVRKQVAKLDQKVLAAAKAKGTPALSSVQTGNGAVEITWAPVPGASSYNLYWGDTPQLQSARPLSKSTGITSPYILTGLANGVVYYYAVSSVSGGIESDLTPVSQINPSALLPLRPEGVSAVNGAGQVTLSWSLAAGASSYNIYRSSSSGVTRSSTKISDAASPYAQVGLTYGQRYYYRVSAQNAAGESILSAEVSGMPLLTAPQNVAISTGNAQNTISWNGVSGAAAYNIYWGNSAGITKTSTKIPGVTGPYAHTGLTNGQAYYYRLAAVNAAEESGLSAEVSALTVPDAPRNVTAAADDGKNTVTWDAVTVALSYNIYWGTAAGITKASGKVLGVPDPCEHTGLTNGQAYYYRVTAVGAAGESALSAEVSGTPKVLLIPDAPQNATVTSNNGQNTVSWDAVADAASYNIYWGTSPGITPGSAKISAAVAPYPHTDLTNGQAYYYRVSAQNASGESGLSAEVNGTPAVISGDRLWTRQLGTDSADYGYGAAADASGNIYVTGRTAGGLDGNTNAGDNDMFLVKYSTSGAKQWTRQLGTALYDEGRGAAADASGNVYVAGYTAGGIDGNTATGGGDMFLVKYNTSGVKQWTKQLGTPSADFGSGAASDHFGNVYVVGYTDGGLDGNANAGGYDTFVVKYSTAGVKLWTRQFGTSGSDFSSGVAADASGNVYIAGYTNGGIDGNTNAGDYDAFLVKYSTAGVKQWTQEFGTSGYDVARGVAVDASGNVYVSGYTAGGLDGSVSFGGFDAFLVKFSASGVKQWTKQLGTASSDMNSAVATDPSGNVYTVGQTEGALDGNTNAGLQDIFLSKYSQ